MKKLTWSAGTAGSPFERLVGHNETTFAPNRQHPKKQPRQAEIEARQTGKTERNDSATNAG